jgi:hypothetical protein
MLLPLVASIGYFPNEYFFVLADFAKTDKKGKEVTGEIAELFSFQIFWLDVGLMNKLGLYSELIVWHKDIYAIGPPINQY